MIFTDSFFSCSIRFRSRSSAWQNDSFRNAVDKTPVFYTEADGDKQGRLKLFTSTFVAAILVTATVILSFV